MRPGTDAKSAAGLSEKTSHSGEVVGTIDALRPNSGGTE